MELPDGIVKSIKKLFLSFEKREGNILMGIELMPLLLDVVKSIITMHLCIKIDLQF
jgi:hypothetical protein